MGCQALVPPLNLSTHIPPTVQELHFSKKASPPVFPLFSNTRCKHVPTPRLAQRTNGKTTELESAFLPKCLQNYRNQQDTQLPPLLSLLRCCSLPMMGSASCWLYLHGPTTTRAAASAILSKSAPHVPTYSNRALCRVLLTDPSDEALLLLLLRPRGFFLDMPVPLLIALLVWWPQPPPPP